MPPKKNKQVEHPPKNATDIATSKNQLNVVCDDVLEHIFGFLELHEAAALHTLQSVNTHWWRVSTAAGGHKGELMMMMVRLLRKFEEHDEAVEANGGNANLSNLDDDAYSASKATLSNFINTLDSTLQDQNNALNREAEQGWYKKYVEKFLPLPEELNGIENDKQRDACREVAKSIRILDFKRTDIWTGNYTDHVFGATFLFGHLEFFFVHRANEARWHSTDLNYTVRSRKTAFDLRRLSEYDDYSWNGNTTLLCQEDEDGCDEATPERLKALRAALKKGPKPIASVDAITDKTLLLLILMARTIVEVLEDGYFKGLRLPEQLGEVLQEVEFTTNKYVMIYEEDDEDEDDEREDGSSGGDE